jgi:hypothetical protein
MYVKFDSILIILIFSILDRTVHQASIWPLPHASGDKPALGGQVNF